jgi:hypothetical protein
LLKIGGNPTKAKGRIHGTRATFNQKKTLNYYLCSTSRERDSTPLRATS